MSQPRWNWKSYPCPSCGQSTLVYDGSVKWRGGPRPPREMARKGGWGFSPRADYEVDHFFHCSQCKTQFSDPIDSSRPTLWAEEGSGRWRYARDGGWQEK